MKRFKRPFTLIELMCVIAVIALLIASLDKESTIMSLVSNAWGIFGAAFGPAILLSLYWKKMTFAGAAGGIVVGAAVDVLWLIFCGSTGIYEIVPGFLAGLIACVALSAFGKQDAAVARQFDKCVKYRD